MFVRKLLFLTIVVLGIFAFCSAESAFGLQKHVLDNGLTVVIRPVPSNPMVAVYGLIKAGGATEGKYLGSGLSHFLEHMLFKGTETRGIGEIAKSIQAVGGSINAQTSYDYTMFTITVPKEAFDTAVELLADALFHSTLDSGEIEKERKVVFGEMRMRRDNPDVYLHDLMYRSVYLNHPYKHPVIGYPDLFAKVTREALYDFYKTYYTPDNMVISIAGSVDEKDALLKVQSVFGAYERSSPIPRNLPEDPWPVSSRYFEDFYPTDMTRIAVAFQSVRLMDPDLFALDVLAKILGQGESSRLYNDLYQNKGLIYGVSSYNYTPYDRGLFVVNAVLDDAHLKEVEQGIVDHIEAFQKDFVAPAELEKAKKQVESEYVMGQQTVQHMAGSMAIDESLTGDPLFSEKYVEGIRAVTAADIKRVAQKYLSARVRTTLVLRPQSVRDAKEQSDAGRTAEPRIEKKILKNGLTILLRADHTLPLVSVTLTSAAGLLREPGELNGISALTADVWTKGTKTRTAEQIASFVESSGMTLDDFSGRNSFGLKMEFLTEDLNKGLDLMEDLVKNPVFPEQEIEKSRQLLKAAIRQRQDDIFDYSSAALRKLLFAGHPYGRDEEGTPETLDRVTRGKILDFYHKLVVSRNMVLAVYGDIDSEKVFNELENRFGKFKDEDLNLSRHELAPLISAQQAQLRMDKQQALVLVGFRGAAMSSPDADGLDVMTSILGSSFSGRLFNRVREELGKAYTVGGQFIPGIDTGGIVFYVLTAPEDAGKVQAIIDEEIARIKTEIVSDQELSDAKNFLKGGHRSRQQTNGSMGLMTALDELYGLGYDHYQSYDRMIDQVLSDDIKRLASQYLDLDQQAVVLTLPAEKIEESW